MTHLPAPALNLKNTCGLSRMVYREMTALSVRVSTTLSCNYGMAAEMMRLGAIGIARHILAINAELTDVADGLMRLQDNAAEVPNLVQQLVDAERIDLSEWKPAD